jgi:hypothetical protein
MRILSKNVSRRTFLLTLAALALPSCGKRCKAGSLEPRDILADLQRSTVIDKLRNGKIKFLHKNLESMSPKGKKAFSIIQRGLFAAGFLQGDPDKLNFGVYGPQTARAVKSLQDSAGIDSNEGRDGMRFDHDALRALEAALEAKDR